MKARILIVLLCVAVLLAGCANDLESPMPNTAEYALHGYVSAWKNQDWKQMAAFSQRSWLKVSQNPVVDLAAYYDFKKVKNFEIINVKSISPSCVDITFFVEYEYVREKKTVNIVGRVIKEAGKWGVNPISTLKEQSSGDTLPKASASVSANEEKADRLVFSIEERNDLSYSIVVRTQFRIRVNRPTTKDELLAICEDIITKEKDRQPHNAISFFFYLPNTNIHSAYTAGKAEWAPYGDWRKADTVRAGDYSRNRLVVIAGNLLD